MEIKRGFEVLANTGRDAGKWEWVWPRFCGDSISTPRRRNSCPFRRDSYFAPGVWIKHVSAREFARGEEATKQVRVPFI